MTRECTKLSCATNGKKGEPALTPIAVDLHTALKSFDLFFVTLGIRQNSAEWWQMVRSVLTGIVAIFGTP